jgi:hypothetical protein
MTQMSGWKTITVNKGRLTHGPYVYVGPVWVIGPYVCDRTVMSRVVMSQLPFGMAEIMSRSPTGPDGNADWREGCVTVKY